MYYALHRKFKKYEMTIIFWLIRTPDKANKFGRSAGVRLNEVLLYVFLSLTPYMPDNWLYSSSDSKTGFYR